MILVRKLAFTAALAAGVVACAQTPAQPDSAASKPPAATRPSDRMAMMDAHMKAMRDMHEKIARSRTPEERNALMAEHMKLMQEGMAMMNGMGSSGMGEMMGGGMQAGVGTPADMARRQQMMEKRMEMMQSMMQMMMDRLPPTSSKQ